MRLLLSTATLLALESVTASQGIATPVTFKCRPETGAAVVDVVVDLDKRWLSFGIAKYEIHSVTDQYVTAIDWGSRGIGGEVFVLDRNTGAYQRAMVEIMERATPGAPNGLSPPALSADVYRGTCTRPLL